MAAFLSSHGVAVVDPQSDHRGKKKDRDPKKGNPGLRCAAEHGDANDHEYRTSEREPGPPAGPQGARESSTTRCPSARDSRRAWRDRILVAQPYAHGELLSPALAAPSTWTLPGPRGD